MNIALVLTYENIFIWFNLNFTSMSITSRSLLTVVRVGRRK